MNNIIELRDIRKTYGEKIQTEVLKGINLDIEKGDFVTIVGSSGSGKSTLVNIMSTIDAQTTGTVTIDNVKIDDSVDKAKLRNETIGFIFQEHYLIDSFNAIDNVLMPNYIKNGKYKSKERERAKMLLSMVGLKGKENPKINELSGGQKQRVAIARALINKPKVIVADEPTGALDSKNSDNIINLLNEINTLENTTIIITHDNQIAKKGNHQIEVVDGEVKSYK